ncbi:MAG: Transcriptional regulatory protein YpdB [Bacteroidetes bacterium ADurb.Bin408]|nr:MAG: Transcriptional regulatory protein YpdB [Bacteroidetes bacterium ADurb.Bin408]
MIKAIAIDDEPHALKIIENFSEKTQIISLLKTFVQPKEALYYMSTFPVDLMFLDIQMPSVSGIEFLKKSEQKTLVIFTTAYSEFAVEGFNMNAVDFLLKPFTYERFLQACQKAESIFNSQQQMKFQDPSCFYVRANYSLVKILYSDIIYIEGLDDYIKIHIQGQSPVVTRMTMRTILEKLPPHEFVRIHRSFIVPLKKITSFRKSKVFIEQIEIPVGVNYKDVMEKLAH